MQNQTIEQGKSYKTRTGLRADILKTIRSSLGIVHVGYVTNHAGTIMARTWNMNGVCECSACLLISLWTEPPVVDWDKFPKHIVVVAMDHNGHWEGFTCIPIIGNDEECSYDWDFDPKAIYPCYCNIEPDDYPAFTGDWRDSLAIRPGHEA